MARRSKRNKLRLTAAQRTRLQEMLASAGKVADAFDDLSLEDLGRHVFEYVPADKLPDLLQKILHSGAKVHDTAKQRRGGRTPRPDYDRCRNAVERAHAKDPERDWYAITHQAAANLNLGVRYVRDSCKSQPPIVWGKLRTLKRARKNSVR